MNLSTFVFATLWSAAAMQPLSENGGVPPTTALHNRVIVEFREPPAVRRLATAATKYEGNFARLQQDLAGLVGRNVYGKTATGPRIRHEYYRLFHGASVDGAQQETIDALRLLPYVAAVHPDQTVQAFDGDRGTPVARRQTLAGGGSGVVVAIIDSGIDYYHPALGGGIGPGFKVVGGYDFVNSDDDPMDDDGHGTHVAGIVAASGAEFQGVAPQASLLAYKVVNQFGNGFASAVIAALERSIDPNGDGELSDRADVVNFSLGGVGSPDDPLARTVENAVAAGIVVVAAMGNDGLYHFAFSPAVARSAISVGAVDGEQKLAAFSNRGPAAKTLSVKPEVVAPGVAIRSAAIGGGTVVFSGTSMAAPHVAGIAALVREAHPDWSPARVKSAVVNSAQPIEGSDVMSQGAGLVDATRAVAAGLFVEPQGLMFGLSSGTVPSWSASRTLTLTNTATESRGYRVTLNSPHEGIAISAQPAEVEVGPGESRQIEVTIVVDHQLLGPSPKGSFSFGSWLHLQSDSETLTVPWAFVKAARVTVTHDVEGPQVFWTSAPPLRRSYRPLDGFSVEMLFDAGVYDIALASLSDKELRVIVRDQQSFDGDSLLAPTLADMPHAVTLEATDERGQPFPTLKTDTAMFAANVRLFLPATSIELPVMNVKTLRVSSLSERHGILVTENWIDAERNVVYVAQHRLLRGLSANASLKLGPQDLQSSDVRVRFPSGAQKRELAVMPRAILRLSEGLVQIPSLRFVVPDATWSGTLYMTPEVHADYASGMSFLAYTDQASLNGLPAMVSPTIRLDERGFFSTREFGVPPLPIEVRQGEALVIGGGPSHAFTSLGKFRDGWGGTLSVYGDRNEAKSVERFTTNWTIFDAAENDVGHGTIDLNGFVRPLPAGAYRASFVAESYESAGIRGQAALDVTFDTRRGDASPPTLTSLAILDGAGYHTSRLTARSHAAIIFSAADFAIGSYERVAAEATRVFYRMGGSSAWVALTPVQLGEDAGTFANLNRVPAGLIYRVDLADALREGGAVELRFEIADVAGNTASWTLAPGFVVQSASGRRRAVR